MSSLACMGFLSVLYLPYIFVVSALPVPCIYVPSVLHLPSVSLWPAPLCLLICLCACLVLLPCLVVVLFLALLWACLVLSGGCVDAGF